MIRQEAEGAVEEQAGGNRTTLFPLPVPVMDPRRSPGGWCGVRTFCFLEVWGICTACMHVAGRYFPGKLGLLRQWMKKWIRQSPSKAFALSRKTSKNLIPLTRPAAGDTEWRGR